MLPKVRKFCAPHELLAGEREPVRKCDRFADSHFVQYIEVYILSKWARFPYGLTGGVRRQSPPLAVCEGTFAGRPRLRGQSQPELSHISQLEKGAFYASLKVVGKLADALDVEPAELLRMPDKR